MLTWLFTKTPLLFFTQSFWRDEAFSYLLAKRGVLEILSLTVKDFSPPFYYLVLHFWMKIFGGSEIAIRSISLIFFWATVYVAFLFLNDIFKYKLKKSFFYLIFFIINPLLLYYAFEARMYSMLAFFAALSFYSFLKKDYKLYLIATILGLYTHYFMIFVVLSQLFFIVMKKKGFLFKVFYPFCSLAIFSPWLIYLFLGKNFAASSFWIGKPQLKYILGFLGIIYTGSEPGYYTNAAVLNKISINLVYLTVVLLVPILIGAYLYFKSVSKKERQIMEILIIWALGIPLVVAIVSFIKPIYLARYLIFTSVGLLLLIIFILEKSNRFLKWILLLILFFLTLNYNQLQYSYRTKVDSRKTLEEITAIANKDDLVYVTSELDFFTAQYYVGENRVFIYGKTYKEIPDYVGKVLIPKEKIVSSLPIYPRKAFVLTPDDRYTIQAIR